MTSQELVKKLQELKACYSPIEYVSKFDTAQEAWDACERGNDMLWLIGKLSGEPWGEGRKKLVLATCECARIVWDLMTRASKDCIVLFERWASGEDVSLEELKKARHAAAAAYITATDAAAYAAAYAAYASATAADAATLKKCADIVRKHYSNIDELFEVATVQ